MEYIKIYGSTCMNKISYNNGIYNVYKEKPPFDPMVSNEEITYLYDRRLL